MESPSLLDRLISWLGNDGAVANAQAVLQTRDRDERAVAQLADRLGSDDDRPVTAA